MMGDSLSPAAFDVAEAKLFSQLTGRNSKLKLDITPNEEASMTLKEK